MNVPWPFDHVYLPDQVPVSEASVVGTAVAPLAPDDLLVIGEAELRREERSAGSLLASAAPSARALATHRPDLALLRDGGRAAIAVEVELTVKSPRRLAAICLAWARARHLAGVLYLAPEGVRPALGRAIDESRSGGRIAVVALETLEASEGSGAIERAITGGP